MAKNLVVLGGGAGAHAMAFDGSLKGYKVNMFELPQFKESFKSTIDGRTIEFIDRTTGKSRGTTKINKATTDIKDAGLESADLVISAMQSLGHEPFAEVVAPHLQEGQIICYIGEGNGGSLILTKVLKKQGLKTNVIVGETNTLPYGARMVGPSKVGASYKKGGTKIAAFPAKNTKKVVDAVKDLWLVEPATNVFETILLNFNAIDHVAPLIPIVGWIDSPYQKEPINLRQASATPTTIRVLDAVDQEALELRKAMGFKDTKVWKDYLIEQGMGGSAKSFATTWDAWVRDIDKRKPEFKTGPGSFEKMGRQIQESTPMGLTLMSSIGDYIGVETPAIDAVVTLTSVMTQRDYWGTGMGRTLEKLGLPKGYSIKELTEYLTDGKVKGKC